MIIGNHLVACQEPCAGTHPAKPALTPRMTARRAAITTSRHSGAKSSSRRKHTRGISKDDVRNIEEMSTLPTPVIYEVVRRLGDEEMERPFTSLWWSGVAAG